LNSNDGSRGPTKKAEGKLPDIERALVNWVNNEQIKGKPLNHSKLQKQAQMFALTVGNPESRFELTSSAWLEKFKQKHNILGAKGHRNLPPVPPLPRSENTSPVSSGSPTQDDARRALDLVRRYF
jgi:hypothetical protein